MAAASPSEEADVFGSLPRDAQTGSQRQRHSSSPTYDPKPYSSTARAKAKQKERVFEDMLPEASLPALQRRAALASSYAKLRELYDALDNFPPRLLFQDPKFVAKRQEAARRLDAVDKFLSSETKYLLLAQSKAMERDKIITTCLTRIAGIIEECAREQERSSRFIAQAERSLAKAERNLDGIQAGLSQVRHNHASWTSNLLNILAAPKAEKRPGSVTLEYAPSGEGEVDRTYDPFQAGHAYARSRSGSPLPTRTRTRTRSVAVSDAGVHYGHTYARDPTKAQQYAASLAPLSPQREKDSVSTPRTQLVHVHKPTSSASTSPSDPNATVRPIQRTNSRQPNPFQQPSSPGTMPKADSPTTPEKLVLRESHVTKLTELTSSIQALESSNRTQGDRLLAAYAQGLEDGKSGTELTAAQTFEDKLELQRQAFREQLNASRTNTPLSSAAASVVSSPLTSGHYSPVRSTVASPVSATWTSASSESTPLSSRSLRPLFLGSGGRTGSPVAVNGTPTPIPRSTSVPKMSPPPQPRFRSRSLSPTKAMASPSPLSGASPDPDADADSDCPSGLPNPTPASESASYDEATIRGRDDKYATPMPKKWKLRSMPYIRDDGGATPPVSRTLFGSTEHALEADASKSATIRASASTLSFLASTSAISNEPEAVNDRARTRTRLFTSEPEEAVSSSASSTAVELSDNDGTEPSRFSSTDASSATEVSEDDKDAQVIPGTPPPSDDSRPTSPLPANYRFPARCPSVNLPLSVFIAARKPSGVDPRDIPLPPSPSPTVSTWSEEDDGDDADHDSDGDKDEEDQDSNKDHGDSDDGPPQATSLAPSPAASQEQLPTPLPSPAPPVEHDAAPEDDVQSLLSAADADATADDFANMSLDANDSLLVHESARTTEPDIARDEDDTVDDPANMSVDSNDSLSVHEIAETTQPDIVTEDPVDSANKSMESIAHLIAISEDNDHNADHNADHAEVGPEVEREADVSLIAAESVHSEPALEVASEYPAEVPDEPFMFAMASIFEDDEVSNPPSIAPVELSEPEATIDAQPEPELHLHGAEASIAALRELAVELESTQVSDEENLIETPEPTLSVPSAPTELIVNILPPSESPKVTGVNLPLVASHSPLSPDTEHRHADLPASLASPFLSPDACVDLPLEASPSLSPGMAAEADFVNANAQVPPTEVVLPITPALTEADSALQNSVHLFPDPVQYDSSKVQFNFTVNGFGPAPSPPALVTPAPEEPVTAIAEPVPPQASNSRRRKTADYSSEDESGPVKRVALAPLTEEVAAELLAPTPQPEEPAAKKKFRPLPKRREEYVQPAVWNENSTEDEETRRNVGPSLMAMLEAWNPEAETEATSNTIAVTQPIAPPQSSHTVVPTVEPAPYPINVPVSPSTQARLEAESAAAPMPDGPDPDLDSEVESEEEITGTWTRYPAAPAPAPLPAPQPLVLHPVPEPAPWPTSTGELSPTSSMQNRVRLQSLPPVPEDDDEYLSQPIPYVAPPSHYSIPIPPSVPAFPVVNYAHAETSFQPAPEAVQQYQEPMVEGPDFDLPAEFFQQLEEDDAHWRMQAEDSPWERMMNSDMPTINIENEDIMGEDVPNDMVIDSQPPPAASLPAADNPQPSRFGSTHMSTSEGHDWLSELCHLVWGLENGQNTRSLLFIANRVREACLKFDLHQHVAAAQSGTQFFNDGFDDVYLPPMSEEQQDVFGLVQQLNTLLSTPSPAQAQPASPAQPLPDFYEQVHAEDDQDMEQEDTVDASPHILSQADVLLLVDVTDRLNGGATAEQVAMVDYNSMPEFQNKDTQDEHDVEATPTPSEVEAADPFGYAHVESRLAMENNGGESWPTSTPSILFVDESEASASPLPSTPIATPASPLFTPDSPPAPRGFPSTPQKLLPFHPRGGYSGITPKRRMDVDEEDEDEVFNPSPTKRQRNSNGAEAEAPFAASLPPSPSPAVDPLPAEGMELDSTEGIDRSSIFGPSKPIRPFGLKRSLEAEADPSPRGGKGKVTGMIDLWNQRGTEPPRKTLRQRTVTPPSEREAASTPLPGRNDRARAPRPEPSPPAPITTLPSAEAARPTSLLKLPGGNFSLPPPTGLPSRPPPPTAFRGRASGDLGAGPRPRPRPRQASGSGGPSGAPANVEASGSGSSRKPAPPVPRYAQPLRRTVNAEDFLKPSSAKRVNQAALRNRPRPTSVRPNPVHEAVAGVSRAPDYRILKGKDNEDSEPPAWR